MALAQIQIPPSASTPDHHASAVDGQSKLDLHLNCSDPQAKSVAALGTWSADALPLHRDGDGNWTVEAPPLLPGAYEYAFLKNDSPKPADDSSGYVLHVPTISDPQYPSTFPHGKVSFHRYTSRTLGVPRECWIYTPPNYEGGSASYPLLVLLHAGADTQRTWVAKGNIDWLLDELIAKGQVHPMVVLMIDGHPHGEMAYLRRDTSTPAMNDLEHELFEEAIPLVEANYRIKHGREYRALAGPSIGGGQTISVGLSHLDQFAWLGAFSASHAIASFYEPSLSDSANLNAKLKLFWISCATGDPEFEHNQKFVAELTSNSINHEWHPTAGVHSWSVWRRDLTEYLCHLF